MKLVNEYLVTQHPALRLVFWQVPWERQSRVRTERARINYEVTKYSVARPQNAKEKIIMIPENLFMLDP